MSAGDGLWRQLSSFERGAVAAALSCPGRDGLALLANLQGVRDAMAIMATASPHQRADFLARVIGATRRAMPEGLERIHPEWLEHALGGVPRSIAEAIVAGDGGGERRDDDRSIPGPIMWWLRQHVFASLVDMPVEPCPGPAVMGVGDLPGLPGATLGRVLGRIGALQLAWALFAAGPGALVEVAQASGSTGGELLQAADLLARLIDEDSERDPAVWLGPARDAQGRVGDLVDRGPLDGTMLASVGCRALAPLVVEHGGDLARQIAQRMPHAIGVQALAAFTGVHGRLSPGRTVSWLVVRQVIAEVWPAA